MSYASGNIAYIYLKEDGKEKSGSIQTRVKCFFEREEFCKDMLYNASKPSKEDFKTI